MTSHFWSLKLVTNETFSCSHLLKQRTSTSLIYVAQIHELILP